MIDVSENFYFLCINFISAATSGDKRRRAAPRNNVSSRRHGVLARAR
jgi:hypothetical protein